MIIIIICKKKCTLYKEILGTSDRCNRNVNEEPETEASRCDAFIRKMLSQRR